MMYTAEQLQVVAKERYGSRKNKAAIEQCLNKRLTFDLTRQLKRPLAMCSNDAKSCYDRIVHSVASPQHATYGCGRTADSVHVYHDPKPASFYPYRVRRFRAHIYRPAMDSPYPRRRSRKWGRPANRGSVSPPVLNILRHEGYRAYFRAAVPVLNILRHEGYGAYFRTAVTGTTISFVGYAFVDDNGSVCYKPKSTRY
jgi:hypothetical protein